MKKINYYLLLLLIFTTTGCSGCDISGFKDFFLEVLYISLIVFVISLIFSKGKIEDRAVNQLIDYSERITLVVTQKLSDMINNSSISINNSSKEIDLLKIKINNYHDEGLKYMEKMLGEIYEKYSEINLAQLSLQKDNIMLMSQMGKYIVEKDEFDNKVKILHEKINECEILKSELRQLKQMLENEKVNNQRYKEKLDKYKIWHSNEHEILDLKNKWKIYLSDGETKKVLTEIINSSQLSSEIRDKATILSGQWSTLDDTIKMGKPIDSAQFNRIFEATKDIVNSI